jgi:hypothetical protein
LSTWSVGNEEKCCTSFPNTFTMELLQKRRYKKIISFLGCLIDWRRNTSKCEYFLPFVQQIFCISQDQVQYHMLYLHVLPERVCICE